MGLRASFVRGRNKARDARGAPLLAEPIDIPEEIKAYVAELEAGLGELTQSTGELQARTAELESVATPLAAALLMPGVKAMLANRFHPDKYPDATAEQRAAYEEAMKVVNEAYTVTEKIQAGENQS